ncbi:MAG: cysteine--tRNA ligase [Bdellovibrionales bacterium]|nr:cysteine--tRNA ligase [Bdellovibrionales bacterium]
MEKRKVKIFNNLQRKKELFEPNTPTVKFYSCGPTTYDFLHVGNARALVVGDLIHRSLKALGYQVEFVRNFTDVDDKIIERANEIGVAPLEHAQKYVEECLKDMNSLGMLPATKTPKVSETMEEIIQMIKDLIDKGFAYEADGEVFYDVQKFKDYGKLSKQNLDSLQHGKRVEVDQRKHHPADFVLWKPAKVDEPSWSSPWGKGRPGWHIECSAMAKKHLGPTIHIHHGGVDLMFPHHENEIAQSEAANGCQFSENWCHNEFLNFGSEKMSKSLGNVITIRSFVETFGGLILRQILLSVHYRSKMDWNQEVIEKALGDMERLYTFAKDINLIKVAENGVEAPKELMEEAKIAHNHMKDAIADDFNVPSAMSALFKFIRHYNSAKLHEKEAFNQKSLAPIYDLVEFAELATGLITLKEKTIDEVNSMLKKAKKALHGEDNKLSDEEIEDLIIQRKEAREQKDWSKADEIRDKLKAAKVVLKDNPDGTVSWSYE